MCCNMRLGKVLRVQGYFPVESDRENIRPGGRRCPFWARSRFLGYFLFCSQGWGTTLRSPTFRKPPCYPPPF